MRSVLIRIGRSSLAGALIAFALATALAAQTSIEDRIPRFVNREKTDMNSRADWVNPPDTPFPLPPAVSADPFTVSYQHQGKTFTLDDYFKRTDVLGFLVLEKLKSRAGGLTFALLAAIGTPSGSDPEGWTTVLDERLVRDVLASRSRTT